ncbi:SURF1 family cytochrome oxidase biogenesis protein, partial [Micromonospora echinofusca]
MGVYRFLLTPRWLGILALTLVASAVMVLLGMWQFSRYEERTAINDRIDNAGRVAPAPLRDRLPAPTGPAGTAGAAPSADTAWTRVTATGRYDNANVILVRGRTVESRVGFEVLTPLVLADGSAVLVDRGWVPPAPGGATVQPQIPDAPTGEVTVVGRVHLTESSPGVVERRNGRIETRRVGVPRIARELPYPVYGAYLLLEEQTSSAEPAMFEAIPIKHENNWLNGGYAVQWWIFAVMALFAYGWLARREARGGSGGTAEPQDRAAEPA